MTKLAISTLHWIKHRKPCYRWFYPSTTRPSRCRGHVSFSLYFTSLALCRQFQLRSRPRYWWILVVSPQLALCGAFEFLYRQACRSPLIRTSTLSPSAAEPRITRVLTASSCHLEPLPSKSQYDLIPDHSLYDASCIYKIGAVFASESVVSARLPRIANAFLQYPDISGSLVAIHHYFMSVASHVVHC